MSHHGLPIRLKLAINSDRQTGAPRCWENIFFPSKSLSLTTRWYKRGTKALMSLKKADFSKRAEFQEAKISLKLKLIEVKENSIQGKVFYEKLEKKLILKHRQGKLPL